LDFDLENDSEPQEQSASDEFCNFRYVITKRNIYTFFTAGKLKDQHLHEEFVNSLLIK
jgi:hypothetical protein